VDGDGARGCVDEGALHDALHGLGLADDVTVQLHVDSPHDHMRTVHVMVQRAAEVLVTRTVPLDDDDCALVPALVSAIARRAVEELPRETPRVELPVTTTIAPQVPRWQFEVEGGLDLGLDVVVGAHVQLGAGVLWPVTSTMAVSTSLHARGQGDAPRTLGSGSVWLGHGALAARVGLDVDVGALRVQPGVALHGGVQDAQGVGYAHNVSVLAPVGDVVVDVGVQLGVLRVALEGEVPLVHDVLRATDARGTHTVPTPPLRLGLSVGLAWGTP
jgi:hypothetical protein